MGLHGRQETGRDSPRGRTEATLLGRPGFSAQESRLGEEGGRPGGPGARLASCRCFYPKLAGATPRAPAGAPAEGRGPENISVYGGRAERLSHALGEALSTQPSLADSPRTSAPRQRTQEHSARKPSGRGNGQPPGDPGGLRAGTQTARPPPHSAGAETRRVRAPPDPQPPGRP